MKVRQVKILLSLMLLITTLCTMASFATPYVVYLDWMWQGVPRGPYNIGFLLGDRGDRVWVFNINWCNGLGLVSCHELASTWLAMSILWGVPMVFTGALTFLIWTAYHELVFWLFPIGFVMQCIGAFGYLIRVLPLFREILQGYGRTVDVSWRIAPVGVIAIIGICFYFVAALIYASHFSKLLSSRTRSD